MTTTTMAVAETTITLSAPLMEETSFDGLGSFHEEEKVVLPSNGSSDSIAKTTVMTTAAMLREVRGLDRPTQSQTSVWVHVDGDGRQKDDIYNYGFHSPLGQDDKDNEDDHGGHDRGDLGGRGADKDHSALFSETKLPMILDQTPRWEREHSRADLTSSSWLADADGASASTKSLGYAAESSKTFVTIALEDEQEEEEEEKEEEVSRKKIKEEKRFSSSSMTARKNEEVKMTWEGVAAADGPSVHALGYQNAASSTGVATANNDGGRGNEEEQEEEEVLRMKGWRPAHEDSEEEVEAEEKEERERGEKMVGREEVKARKQRRGVEAEVGKGEEDNEEKKRTYEEQEVEEEVEEEEVDKEEEKRRGRVQNWVYDSRHFDEMRRGKEAINSHEWNE